MASLITSNTASTDISIHSQTARTASLNHSNWLYAQITAAISAAMPAMINVIGDNIAAVTATKTAFRATNPAIIAGINPTSKSNGPTINANAAAIAAIIAIIDLVVFDKLLNQFASFRSEEHTSELQSRGHL